jgi:hypothetical protein
MPYRSLAQERYFNANRGKMERQGVDVDEWNQASKGADLPRRVAVKRKRVDLGSKGSFTEHPGAEHRALGIPLGETIPASAHERAAHSSNPRLRRMEASAKGFRAMRKG